MKKAALLSVGCKTNQYEAEALKEELIRLGFEITDFNEKADVYIVNTCSVTAEAARKSKQMIRRAQGRNALICVMGCFSELDPEEVKEISDVCIIAGTGGRSKIVSYLKEAFDKREKVIIPSQKDRYENISISDFSDKTRAYIKIEDGCDNFCSYCVIPYARGPVRSRALCDIIEEAERLAGKGFMEVVVTGINICKYSFEDKGLYDVLHAINSIDGIKRIRLGSIYPDYIDGETSDLLAGIDKLCPHFHISLQSGSTKILDAMNRKYTSEQAYENLKILSGKFSCTLLSADVIVGFPGENCDDFADTVDFISSLPFYHTHVFKYSIRKGTKAASMSGQINEKVKNERSKSLIELSGIKKKQIIDSYTGKELNCIFECGRNASGNEFYGHTDNFIDIICKGTDLAGHIHKVTVKGYENGYARAVLSGP